MNTANQLLLNCMTNNVRIEKCPHSVQVLNFIIITHVLILIVNIQVFCKQESKRNKINHQKHININKNIKKTKKKYEKELLRRRQIDHCRVAVEIKKLFVLL